MGDLTLWSLTLLALRAAPAFPLYFAGDNTITGNDRRRLFDKLALQ
jgi:hypothetical protein